MRADLRGEAPAPSPDLTSRASPPVGPGFILGHLAVCSLAWGSSFLFIKLIGADVPPVALAALRGLLAAVVVSLYLIAIGQIPLPRRNEWAPWAIIGLLNGAGPNTLVAYAMQHMDSGPAVLIQSIGPLATAVAAHFMFAEERLGKESLLGIVVGLCGVALLIGPEAIHGSATLPAALAMLGVSALYTLSNLYTRTVRHHDPARLALGQQFFSAIFAGAAALLTVGPQAFAHAADHPWALVTLSVLCTALPINVFMRLIVRAGPTRAALTGYTVPAVAVVIGAIFLHERLTIWQIAGGLTVMTGVYLVASAKRARIRGNTGASA